MPKKKNQYEFTVPAFTVWIDADTLDEAKKMIEKQLEGVMKVCEDRRASHLNDVLDGLWQLAEPKFTGTVEENNN